VLVVEDDKPLRRLTVRRVRHLGHDTLEAADGPSALAVAEAHLEIELLVTDMIMPNGLSGLELARRLREHRPDFPVLITSGHSEEKWSADVLHDERIVFLKKPYDSDAFASSLRELLTEPTEGHGVGGPSAVGETVWGTGGHPLDADQMARRS